MDETFQAIFDNDHHTAEGLGDTARAHAIVSGNVQGVFFRHQTLEQANSKGVAGWVRNLSGGKVEAVFEGPRKSVEEMIAWCSEGPRKAQVESVHVEWEQPDEESVFRIR